MSVKKRLQDVFEQTGSLRRAIVSILLAMVIGALIVYLQGDNPLVAYTALFRSAFGSRASVFQTLANSTPLIVTGIAAAITFRTGVVNLGVEGQLYMGGLAAALVGVYLEGVPSFLHVFLALLAGCVVSFIWAAPFQWLRVQFGANELVTTTLSNYVAILLTTYLVAYPFMKPGAPLAMTKNVLPSAYLPRLVSQGRLNLGFIIGAVLCVFVWYVINRSSLGFEFRMIGANKRFSHYVGIRVKRMQVLAMGLSGAAAGLAGAIEVLGTQHRFIQNISPGYGWVGVLVALMASNNPIAVLPVGILFGALKTGGLGMEAATNVPSELSDVLQAIIILFFAANVVFPSLRKESVLKKKHAEIAHPEQV